MKETFFKILEYPEADMLVEKIFDEEDEEAPHAIQCKIKISNDEIVMEVKACLSYEEYEKREEIFKVLNKENMEEFFYSLYKQLKELTDKLEN